MWPFTKKQQQPQETKAQSPTVQVLTTGAPSQPNLYRKAGISYEQMACEGYSKNAIAYRTIDEVATSVSLAPWLLYRRTNDKPEEMPLPLVMQRPNPWESWATLLYNAVSYYRIDGNSYFEAIAPSIKQPPSQIYLHRPDMVRPTPGRTGLAAYSRLINGVWRPLWPVDPITGQSNILHLKTFNPLDDLIGLSPIAAAALGIDVHNDANTWNANLLRKGASADILIVSERPLADKQYSRLKEQMEHDGSGKNNAGNTLLIEGVPGGKIEAEKFSFSPRDMSWLDAKNTSAHEVALVLGGSAMPFLLGLSNLNTFANQETGRLAFWDTTVIPLLYRIRDEMNVWLAPRFGPELYFDVNLDVIPALEPRREAAWNRLEKADFLTINEKREALGYDPVDGGDVVLQAATMIPLGSEPAPPQGTQPGQPAQTKAEAFEQDLRASGLSPELAKQMAELTFLKNGSVH